MDQDKVNPFVGNTEAPAGGAPISVPPTPVNPYAPAGAPYAPGSNTPAPSYASPMSDSPAVPNTGSSAYTSFSPAPSQNSQDIFMPSDASTERPKLFTKKFIIFAVIGLIFIAGAVVAGIVIQNNKKGGTTNSSTDYKATAKPYFDNYVKYLVFGNETSSSNVGEALASSDPIYAEKMMDEDTSTEKSSYLENLNNKYALFYDKYKLSNDTTYDLNSLKLYFYDLASISVPSLEEIQEWYSTSGYDKAKQNIDQDVNSTSSDEQIKDYISLARQESYDYLDFVDKILSAGCTIDNFVGCYNGIFDTSEVNEVINKKENIASKLGDNAFVTIRGLYDYYGGVK